MTYQVPTKPPVTLRELVRGYVLAVRDAHRGERVVTLAKLLGAAPSTIYRIIRGKEAIHTFGQPVRRQDEEETEGP